VSADILPICTTRSLVGEILINGRPRVPCYCMNCGKQHGFGDKPHPGSGYLGFICDLCAETWSTLVGTMLVPDEVHAARCRDEMLESHGRALTEPEILKALDDATSPLSLLVRERMR
jgi:hypothetical protein